MKPRYLASLAALVAVFLALSLPGRASTTTTLLSQNFNASTWPPTGWSTNYVGEYNYLYGGTYWSSGGNGGSNGSGVISTFYCYQPNCYTGYNPNGTVTLTTPPITTSSYGAADSMFVDFDLWFPYGWYQANYSSYCNINFKVLVGTTVLMSVAHPTSPSPPALYTGSQSPTDPSSYTSSAYWVHYRLAIPFTKTTTAITFQCQDNNTTCYWGYMYCENVAIDNVVVTDVHYNLLTLTGPAAINFGLVPEPFSAGPYYSTISNPNASPISLTGYTITGANPGDFTVTRFPSSIPAGGKDSVGVLYTPQGGGARNATLNITSTADNNQVLQVGLSGVGLVPGISLSSNVMFRGTATELDSTSAVQYLYVNSTGGAPLKINSVSFYGLDSRAYTVTRIPPNLIPPGGVDSIGVKFSPDIEGIPDAHMVINSTAANIPVDTVLMFGLGILPHLSLTTANPANIISNLNHTMVVNFDSVKLGTDSCTQILLSNPGSDTIAIMRNYLSGRDFDYTLTPFTGAADTLIPPGGSQTMQVCFQPLQRGYRTATLTIKTNIPHTQTSSAQDTSTFMVQFIGAGVPTGALTITGSPTDTELVGKKGCTTDTLWNTGGADLTVTNLTISGTNAADFNGTYGTLPLTIPANSFKTISVCGTPGDTGIASGVLTGIGTSGNTGVTATLPLQVYGTRSSDTVFVLKPFGNTCVGSTDTATVVVVTTGNIPSTYTANTASGTNPSDFVVLAPTSSSLEQGGDTASFKVVFTPTTNTNESTNFNVVGGPGGTAALNATGSAAAITGSGTAPATAVGATSSQFPVTITNSGTCDWTPGIPTSSDPEFTYVSGGTTSIAPTATGTLMYTFSPTANGAYSSTLSFPGQTGVSMPAAVVKINGSLDLGVPEVVAMSGFSLGQNYPNPVQNGTQTTVEVTVPASSAVHLAIVDVKGEVVEQVLDRHFDAGTYAITLDAGSLASGTYYYQLTAPGGVTLTRQMTVVR